MKSQNYIESNNFSNQFSVNKQNIESLKVSSRFSCISIIKSKSNELNEYLNERQRIINIFNVHINKRLKSDKNLSLDSFYLLRRLGEGGYGSVFLVHHKDTNEYHALKAIEKSTLIQTNEQNTVLSERQYTFALNHPNIVQLITSFQDNNYIYLLFEWLCGGDLYSLMNYRKLTELQAKFYSAQIVLALDYLHQCKIVFRDLKPENIVLNERGYIKLIDLGLAKLIRGRSKTFCGTPHYIAPEVILRQPYTVSPDYWTLGIIIHEMVTGDAPYDRTYRIDSNTDQTLSDNIEYDMSDTIPMSSRHYNMYLRIIDGCSTMKLEHLSENCSLIIRNLLEYNIEQRLGCGQRGTLDIFEHPWFDKINFWTLYKQEYIAPFIPIRKNFVNDIYQNERALRFTANDHYENEFIGF